MLYFWHFLVSCWALSTLWQSPAMVGILEAVGAVLACSWLLWKCFPSPALGFKLKYVLLVMLGTLFCLLYQVFKDGEGVWDFIICCLVSLVIPAMQGGWRTAWSSAYRVSWRGVEDWVEGGGWSHHLLLLLCDTDRNRETGRSPSSSSLPVSHAIWQDTQKTAQGWRTHFAYSSRNFSPLWWAGVGRAIELNSTWKKPG